MDASGFHGNVSIHLLNDYRGGGVESKKRKILISDMKALEYDPDPIKALFAETSFKPAEWLNTLTKAQVQDYLNDMGRYRSAKDQSKLIVERLTPFTVLRDLYLF